MTIQHKPPQLWAHLPLQNLSRSAQVLSPLITHGMAASIITSLDSELPAVVVFKLWFGQVFWELMRINDTFFKK